MNDIRRRLLAVLAALLLAPVAAACEATGEGLQEDAEQNVEEERRSAPGGGAEGRLLTRPAPDSMSWALGGVDRDDAAGQVLPAHPAPPGGGDDVGEGPLVGPGEDAVGEVAVGRRVEATASARTGTAPRR